MAIVAAFMAQPEIYLLDEPSTGLDPLMRDTMVDIIREQKALGKTVFMSSHVFKEMEDTCDTVMFIRDGKIQTTVRRSQYEADPRETYTVSFQTPQAYEAYLQRVPKSGGRVVVMHENARRLSVTVTVRILETNEFLRCLSAYPIAGIEHATYSLEKYYMKNIERTEVSNV